jgi:hypothetical protein
MRLGYNRFQQWLAPASQDKNYVGEIGINGVVTDKYVRGPPNITISNLMAIGTHPYSPSRPTTNTFEVLLLTAVASILHWAARPARTGIPGHAGRAGPGAGSCLAACIRRVQADQP